MRNRYWLVLALLFVVCAPCMCEGSCETRVTNTTLESAAKAKKKKLKGKTETGEASYYADKFVGKPTASGEKYSHKALTAAHRTHPFGTKLRVTNLSNGKSVEVRVNDRGPFKRGRIVDLSLKAAKQIDMVRQGVAKVKVEVISFP